MWLHWTQNSRKRTPHPFLRKEISKRTTTKQRPQACDMSLQSRQALNTVQSIPKGSKPAQLQQQLRSKVSAPNAWYLRRLCPTLCDPAISPGQTVLKTRVSCSQWEGSACTHEGSSFFSFCRVRILCFFFYCSHDVLMGFPKASPCSQVVPQDIPIAPQFYPIWFCTKFNSRPYKLERLAIGEHICFYDATWGLERCLMFQKNC